MTRVEEATREAWTKVLTSPKGKAVRADYTRVRPRSRAGSCGARSWRSTPFERLLAESVTEIDARARRARRRPRAARAGCSGCAAGRASRRSSCAWPPRRQVDGALDGLGERPGRGTGGSRCAGGAGARTATTRAARTRPRAAAATSSASSPASVERHVALEEVRLPEPAPAGGRARGASRTVVGGRAACARTASARVEHAAGRSYPDLVRLRSGDGSSAPDAVLCPGSAEQVAAVLERLRRASAWRWCRSAAARAWWAGWSRVARRLRRRGLARPAPARPGARDVDRESLTATLEAGLLGPAAEARLAAQGLTLGPLPAVLRVRDGRRLGGHPLGRARPPPATGASTSWCEGCAAWRRPASSAREPCPASAAGPALRELVVGSEGVLGVITEATLGVRPAPGAAPLRGLVVPRASPRGWRRSG